MDSKPPAVDVDVRISMGERHDFGASAPSPTRTSSLLIGRAGGLTTLPKLVELVGPSTAGAEEISPCSSLAAAAPSVPLRAPASLLVCSYVYPRGETWLLSWMLQSC